MFRRRRQIFSIGRILNISGTPAGASKAPLCNILFAQPSSSSSSSTSLSLLQSSSSSLIQSSEPLSSSSSYMMMMMVLLLGPWQHTCGFQAISGRQLLLLLLMYFSNQHLPQTTSIFKPYICNNLRYQTSDTRDQSQDNVDKNMLRHAGKTPTMSCYQIYLDIYSVRLIWNC